MRGKVSTVYFRICLVLLMVVAQVGLQPVQEAFARGGGRSGGGHSGGHRSGGRSSSGSHVSVKSYTTKSGKYVASHKRTGADHSKGNNWSTKGNVNPYTGKKGYKKP